MARYYGKRVVIMAETSGIGLATAKLLIYEPSCYAPNIQAPYRSFCC